MRRALALTLLLLAGLLAACGSSGSKTSSTTAAPKAPAATTAKPSAPAVGANGCQQVTAPPAKPNGGGKKPKRPLDASKTWTLTVRTSCGLFTIKLDLKAGPQASASMVSLANAGFFRNTTFHRIVPGFVIQGGDPTGSGMGGPGYKTVDPPPKNAKYTKGVVAMAKTAQEKAGTGGSQFYVVTGADAGLPPDYAIIGKVTTGLDTVARIGALGDPNDPAGTPTQPVIIYDITAKGP